MRNLNIVDNLRGRFSHFLKNLFVLALYESTPEERREERVVLELFHDLKVIMNFKINGKFRLTNNALMLP